MFCVLHFICSTNNLHLTPLLSLFISKYTPQQLRNLLYRGYKLVCSRLTSVRILCQNNCVTTLSISLLSLNLWPSRFCFKFVDVFYWYYDNHWSLMFRGPWIVSIFLLIYFQRDATLHSSFISGKLLYMFRVVSPPIIRRTYNCIKPVLTSQIGTIPTPHSDQLQISHNTGR